MTIEKMLEWSKANSGIISAPRKETYPAKPAEAKTLRQWFELEMRPVRMENMKIYRMRYNNGVWESYGYYLPQDVVDMTPDEVAEYKQITRAAKNASKQSVSTPSIKFLTADEFSKKQIIVLDLETTGFSPERDDILQISIIDNHHHKLDEYIRPILKRSWPEAEKANHISYDMVKNAKTISELRPLVERIISSADYVVGHNVGFDLKFILQKFSVKVDEDKVIDTLKLFKQLCPNAKNHKLETLTEMFASDRIKAMYADGAHNSLVDIRATYEGLIGLCKLAASTEQHQQSLF